MAVAARTVARRRMRIVRRVVVRGRGVLLLVLLLLLLLLTQSTALESAARLLLPVRVKNAKNGEKEEMKRERVCVCGTTHRKTE